MTPRKIRERDIDVLKYLWRTGTDFYDPDKYPIEPIREELESRYPEFWEALMELQKAKEKMSEQVSSLKFKEDIDYELKRKAKKPK